MAIIEEPAVVFTQEQLEKMAAPILDILLSEEYGVSPVCASSIMITVSPSSLMMDPPLTADDSEFLARQLEDYIQERLYDVLPSTVLN